MADRTQSTTASIINIILGVWLIISPLVIIFPNSGQATNAVIVGIIVAVLSLIRAFTPETTAGLNWINIVLGAWLIISPFLFGSNISVLWSDIVSGILVIVFSGWSGSAAMVHAGHKEDKDKEDRK